MTGEKIVGILGCHLLVSSFIQWDGSGRVIRDGGGGVWSTKGYTLLRGHENLV